MPSTHLEVPEDSVPEGSHSTAKEPHMQLNGADGDHAESDGSGAHGHQNGTKPNGVAHSESPNAAAEDGARGHMSAESGQNGVHEGTNGQIHLNGVGEGPDVEHDQSNGMNGAPSSLSHTEEAEKQQVEAAASERKAEAVEEAAGSEHCNGSASKSEGAEHTNGNEHALENGVDDRPMPSTKACTESEQERGAEPTTEDTAESRNVSEIAEEESASSAQALELGADGETAVTDEARRNGETSDNVGHGEHAPAPGAVHLSDKNVEEPSREAEVCATEAPCHGSTQEVPNDAPVAPSSGSTSAAAQDGSGQDGAAPHTGTADADAEPAQPSSAVQGHASSSEDTESHEAEGNIAEASRPTAKKAPTEEDDLEQQRLIEDLVAAAMAGGSTPGDSSGGEKPSSLTPLPQVGGVGVPPKKLEEIVNNHGGFDEVNLNKLWASVARELGIDTKKCTSAAHCLKRIFYQYVLNQPMPSKSGSPGEKDGKDVEVEQPKKKQSKSANEDVPDADAKLASDVLSMLSQSTEESQATVTKPSKKEASASDEEESKPDGKKQAKGKQDQEDASSEEEDDGDEDSDKKDGKREKGDDTPTKEGAKRRTKKQVMEQLSSERQLSREERKFQAILRQIEMAERKEKEARGEYVEPEKTAEEPPVSAQKKRKEAADSATEADSGAAREKKRPKTEAAIENSRTESVSSEAADENAKNATPATAAAAAVAPAVAAAKEDSPAPSASSGKGKKGATKPPPKTKEKLVVQTPSEEQASGDLAAMKRHKAFFTGSERTACLPRKCFSTANGMNGFKSNGLNGRTDINGTRDTCSPTVSGSGTPTGSSAPGTPRNGVSEVAKSAKMMGGKKAYIYAAVTAEYGLNSIAEFESNGYFDQLNIVKPCEVEGKLNPCKRIANPAKHTLKRRFLTQWIMEQNGLTAPAKVQPQKAAEPAVSVKKEPEQVPVENADAIKPEIKAEDVSLNANEAGSHDHGEGQNGHAEIPAQQEAPFKKEEDAEEDSKTDDQPAGVESVVPASMTDLPRIPKRSADPLDSIKIPKKSQLASQENSGQNSPVPVHTTEHPASPAITFKPAFVRDGSNAYKGEFASAEGGTDADRFALGKAEHLAQLGSSRDGTPGSHGLPPSPRAAPKSGSWDIGGVAAAAQPRRQSAWDQPPPQYPPANAISKDAAYHSAGQLSPAVERDFERASNIRNLPDMRDLRRVEPSPPGMRRRGSSPPSRPMFGGDMRERGMPVGEAGLSRESLRREREEVMMRERDRDRDRDRFGPYTGGLDSPRGRMSERSPPRWDHGGPRSRSPRALERSLGREAGIGAPEGVAPARDRSLSPRSKELQREMQAARERRASKDPMDPGEGPYNAVGPAPGPAGNGWWPGGPASRGPHMAPGAGVGVGPGPMRRDRPSMFDQRRPRPYASSPARSR